MRQLGVGLVGSILLLLPSPQADAGELTAKVQQTYRELESLQAEFVQRTTIEVLEREVTESGRLVLARPGRFIIEYRGKSPRKYISDGKTLWIWRAKEKRLETLSDLHGTLSREALTFLSGLGEMEKEFRVTEELQSLRLAPRDPDSPFKKIVMRFDPETHLASEIHLFPKSGNQSRYFLSQIKKNEKIPPNEFRP